MAETTQLKLAFPTPLSDNERLLVDRRREAVAKLADDAAAQKQIKDGSVVGFALSGGGIRSATFCLGVFQALASFKLLRKIDYISSVSGGGYFASFLGRLFSRDDIGSVAKVEDILNPDTPSGPGIPELQGWESQVFQWLCEHGRYLAPKGSGDLLLDLAVAFRNWVSVQVVIIIFVFLTLVSAQLLRAEIERNWGSLHFDSYLPFGYSFWWSPYILVSAFFLLIATAFGWAYWLVEGWASARVWQIPPVVGAFAAIALSVAAAGWSKQAEPKIYWICVVVILVDVLAILLWLAARLVAQVRANRAKASALEKTKALAAGEAQRLYARGEQLYKYSEARNWLSAMFKSALVITVATAIFALIDSAAQTLYASSFANHHFKDVALALYGALVAVAPFAKWIVAGFGQKPGAKRLPVSGTLLAGTAAVIILFLTYLFLDAASHAVAWQFQPPSDAPSVLMQTAAPAKCTTTVNVGGQVYSCASPAAASAPYQPEPSTPFLLPSGRPFPEFLGFGFLAALVLSFLFGRTWTFLNRSSLHALYAARLTRAYLGASNSERYKEDSTRLSDADRGDDIDQEQYWPPLAAAPLPTPYEKGAPLHLVNVTINETLDGRSQVQQQDRKGFGMAIGPAGISAGVLHHVVFKLNAELGKQYNDVQTFPEKGFRVFEYPPGGGGARDFAGEQMSLGAWTGVSGAAFSTGLGLRTSLALSFLAGFFNVRLGYWWDSGVSPGARSQRAKRPISRFVGSFFNWLFPVQTFFLDEYLARFHGSARQQWYLTDGGHFENMGAYELIRRRLPMIVVIDAEEDEDYTFEGLANLVMKARLDFDAEIRFLSEDELDAAVNGQARRYFGTLDQLRRGTWAEEPVEEPNSRSSPNRPKPRRLHVDPDEERLSLAHAALARVYYEGKDCAESTLMLIKPSLTGDEPTDVRRFHTEHPDFPQQTTLDQFFSEGQWESYRKLGEHIGRKLFSPVTGDALFHPNLLRPLPSDTAPRL